VRHPPIHKVPHQSKGSEPNKRSRERRASHLDTHSGQHKEKTAKQQMIAVPPGGRLISFDLEGKVPDNLLPTIDARTTTSSPVGLGPAESLVSDAKWGGCAFL
jgi:hypothetical protein